MGPDLDTAGVTAAPRTRCPGCAATVRPDAPWCTQCYADLRPPAPAPAPAAPATPAPVPVPVPVALTAPEPAAAPLGSATWPCATCGTANAIELPACAACGAGFLSALRATEEPLLVLPVVGDLGAMSRGQRLGLAAGVVLVVLLLVALLGLLLG